ncbi:hypothetical protein AC612_05445 [Xanthomonas citri pv. fuscans]|nr:hypothetical protein AC613_05445 [Xanthomonas citri pv. fuscans]AZU23641.1 hypothetical protein AC612_05445 [Xanthomonas citri pv. fuscans]AZU91806.1 hypothetical protein AC614_05450 [Xanthomonas citri pv. fuscans]
MFHQRIQIGFPGRSFVVDLQSYFSSLLSGGDKELLFAYRRKVYKELMHDERSKPMIRRRLKQLKMKEQQGICPLCNELLPERGAVLDRTQAVDGYTPENTRLIHAACDVAHQAAKGYA